MAVHDLALVRRRMTIVAGLRATTGATLRRVFESLDGWGTEHEARFVEIAGPIVEAGQTRAATTQIAYLEAVLDEKLPVDLDAILNAAKVELSDPFVAFAAAIAAGNALEAAIESGAARADALGDSAVQWASRAGNNAAEGNTRISGWSRTLDGSACEWCIEAADQTYRSADSASFGHANCGCGVDPVLDDRNVSSILNSETLGP